MAGLQTVLGYDVEGLTNKPKDDSPGLTKAFIVCLALSLTIYCIFNVILCIGLYWKDDKTLIKIGAIGIIVSLVPFIAAISIKIVNFWPNKKTVLVLIVSGTVIYGISLFQLLMYKYL